MIMFIMKINDNVEKKFTKLFIKSALEIQVNNNNFHKHLNQ